MLTLHLVNGGKCCYVQRAFIIAISAEGDGARIDTPLRSYFVIETPAEILERMQHDL